MQPADSPAVYAAAITPRSARGEMDFGAAFELIDFLGRSGVQGIALFTAAGEYAAIPASDRARLTLLAVKRSRVPLLAGVGSATLDEAVALGRQARDAGVVGLLVPPPYFFRYEQDDLREYYEQFAAQVEGVPLYLSSISDCATAIELETALGLLEAGQFAGLEDECGGFEPVAAAGHTLLAGHDRWLRRAVAAGARIAVSAAACAIPELVLALARRSAAGDGAETDAIEAKIGEFLDWEEQAPRPVILKTAVAMRGLKTGPINTPLSPEKARRLAAFREWFPVWLPAGAKRSAKA